MTDERHGRAGTSGSVRAQIRFFTPICRVLELEAYLCTYNIYTREFGICFVRFFSYLLIHSFTYSSIYSSVRRRNRSSFSQVAFLGIAERVGDARHKTGNEKNREHGRKIITGDK